MTAVEHVGASAPSWVEWLTPTADLAKLIAGTDFVPEALRHKPAAIAACVMYGRELGVDPMTALAKIAIVKGRPAPSAELGRALAIAAGHSIWIETATTTRATVCGQRRGDERVHTVTWTTDDAKRAGIAGSAAWRAYPRAMLVARASSELVRQAFPDVLGGITVFAEELDDDGVDRAPAVAAADATGTPPSGTTRRKRTPRATSAAAATPSQPATDRPALPMRTVVDVDLDGPMPELPLTIPPPEPSPPTDGHADDLDRITPAQLRAMHAAMNDAGITERADRLAFATAAVGHPVESSKALTRAEASTVIDSVNAVNAGELAVTIGVDGWTLAPTGEDA